MCDSSIAPCLQFRVVNCVTIVDPQLGVPIRGFSIAASVQIGVVDCVAIVDPQRSPTQLSASLETSGVRSRGWRVGVEGAAFDFRGRCSNVGCP